MPTRTEVARKRILKLVPDLPRAQVGRSWKLHAPGFMDLCVEVVDRGVQDKTRYADVSLAHYYEQNGDLMADPEMVVRVYLDDSWPHADALSFRQDGGLAYVSESYAYDDAGARVGVYKARHADNNAFLAQWLRNVEAQGHRYVPAASRTARATELAMMGEDA